MLPGHVVFEREAVSSESQGLVYVICLAGDIGLLATYVFHMCGSGSIGYGEVCVFIVFTITTVTRKRNSFL